jgi:hypothetical protein
MNREIAVGGRLLSKREIGVVVGGWLAFHAQPASACRHFSIWHYDFPQPCSIARSAAKTVDVPAAPEIPLPDLTDIDWGEAGDERLAATAILRALSGGR